MEYDGKSNRDDAEYGAYVLLCRSRGVRAVSRQRELSLGDQGKRHAAGLKGDW